MIRITEDNFLTYCMNNYDNRHCSDISEFEDDLRRIQHIKKLIIKYKQSGILRERLILNHVIVLFNVFGKNANEILFLKIGEYKEILKPFIQFINFLPEIIYYSNHNLETNTIKSDQFVIEKLKRIIPND
jgi:hypothetical protein